MTVSESEWPTCEYPECKNPVNPRRIRLIGKCRCLEHGDPPKNFAVAPAFNKGGYQLITHGDIEDIGK